MLSPEAASIADVSSDVIRVALALRLDEPGVQLVHQQPQGAVWVHPCRSV